MLAWCSLYTLAVPGADRVRRREELASHVWEWLEAHGSGVRARARLLLASAAGVLHDLSWCNDVRTERGLMPLALAVVGPVGGLVAGGILITIAAAASLFEVWTLDVIRNAAEILALLVISTSLTLRAARHWRSRGA